MNKHHNEHDCEKHKYHHEPPPCEPRPKKCHERFKIECVIVCHDYSDFLRHTLPHNKHLFDKIVVVTSPEDLETKRVCEFYHVECVRTDVMKTAEGKFCKGAGINAGLAKLDKDGWVLHLDADIWLPPQTRILLERADLNPQMVYGIDRFNVRGFHQWHEFLAQLPLQHEDNTYIHLNRCGLDVGTRIMQGHMGGWISIGFFQLWHPKHSCICRYPEGHTNAGREDLLFTNQWARRDRGFIPEIIGYHLESEDAGYGTNWGGRKTSRFELPKRIED